MRCQLLYLVGQLGSGGLERQLYFLLRGMDRERYQPQVVVWNFRQEDDFVSPLSDLAVTLHSFPNTLSPAAKVKAFRRLVLELKPEVIHSYSFFTNVPASLATIGTNIIAIGAVQSDFITDKEACGSVLGRLSARWPRRQIYNSFAGAEHARNCRSFFRPSQLFVVRNGLDLAQFRSVPLDTNREVRIVGVGSLLQVKRWDRLLKAALHLKQKGLQFLVQIIGDGPLRETLEQQAEMFDIGERIQFLGRSRDIPRLLGDATFLAHTSEAEGCPNAVMEAMACGRAVVATDAGDIPSLIEDGKTGFVVPRGDDAQLLERLATLISNRDLCRRMGEASRAKAEREFGMDRLIDQTLAAYRSAGWKDA